MSTIKDGGLAFPYRETESSGQYCHHYGISVRDYFAAQALAGILSSGDVEIKTIVGDKWAAASLTQSCYIIADAMVDAREAKL